MLTIKERIQTVTSDILPSNRALLLQTPPLKYHFVSATRQMITPVTAIRVVAVHW